MELFEITCQEYSTLVDEFDIPIYNKSIFLELNRNKVGNIHYLLGKDTKKRIAFAIGERTGEWDAPFSAPFSSIVELVKNTSVESLHLFFGALINHVKGCGGKCIRLSLPANIYGEHLNARVMNALLENGFALQYIDINYSFVLSEIELQTYESTMRRNARKNLRISMRSGLSFQRCSVIAEIEEAYDVVAANRASKGYPLRMTKEQVLDTISIVDHDCFIVKMNGRGIASAIVYRVTSTIAQVIYWGDVPGYARFKPMNYIAYCLICFYKKLGYRVLDIGISTDKGVPNYGLCSFKESVGCVASSKMQFTIEL